MNIKVTAFTESKNENDIGLYFCGVRSANFKNNIKLF